MVFRGNGGGTTYNQQRLKGGGGIENQLLERKGNKNITEPEG